jgi:rare lipoprotein A
MVEIEEEKTIQEELTMNLKTRKWMIVYRAVACQLLAFLVMAFPLHAEITELPGTNSKEQTVPKEQKDSYETEKTEGTPGRACYYKKSLNNRKTSSGAVYRPWKLTAAHPTIPLGTRVKVVNLANKRSVIVTINDRCRKHSYEIIDISLAAARQLGFLGKGMQRVLIKPIGK